MEDIGDTGGMEDMKDIGGIGDIQVKFELQVGSRPVYYFRNASSMYRTDHSKSFSSSEDFDQ